MIEVYRKANLQIKSFRRSRRQIPQRRRRKQTNYGKKHRDCRQKQNKVVPSYALLTDSMAESKAKVSASVNCDKLSQHIEIETKNSPKFSRSKTKQSHLYSHSYSHLYRPPRSNLNSMVCNIL